jgi:hypothetical protein
VDSALQRVRALARGQLDMYQAANEPSRNAASSRSDTQSVVLLGAPTHRHVFKVKGIAGVDC